MDSVKLQEYLNIAKKAGYVIIGGDKLYNYNKKLYLVLYDKEAGRSTQKIVEKLKDREIPILSVENLQNFLNIPNCKLIGIKNKSLSDIICNIIKE